MRVRRLRTDNLFFCGRPQNAPPTAHLAIAIKDVGGQFASAWVHAVPSSSRTIRGRQGCKDESFEIGTVFLRSSENATDYTVPNRTSNLPDNRVNGQHHLRGVLRVMKYTNVR